MDYDKICSICNQEFYSKNLNVKYCSETCAKNAHREQQRIASTKWRKKDKRGENKL